MFSKYIIIFISLLITESFGQTLRGRGPRDYEEPLPVSRSSLPTNHTNEESDGSERTGNISIPLKLKGFQIFKPSIPLLEEPLGCSKCLNQIYLSHYYERGCKPVAGELNCNKPCPQYFDCPKKDHKTASKGCEYKNFVYRVGEKVPVDDPCKKSCYCDQDLNSKNISKPTIRCADVDCFNIKAPQKHCYNVYEPGKCCPREHCPSRETYDPEHKCHFEGKQYRLGQRMHPKEDPCTQCTCNEHWKRNNPLNSTQCKRVECYMASNSKFSAGCLPIYRNNTCCPIDYYCPAPEEHYCLFNEKKYRIGENLNIGRNDRTECKCIIPPDFTCIEKSYPLEAPDYVKEFQTLPKINITNNPFKDLPVLSESKGCPPYLEGGLTCTGIDCTTVLDSNGCQACSCQRPCPHYKCRSSCRLYAVTPGECPKCKCDLILT